MTREVEKGIRYELKKSLFIDNLNFIKFFNRYISEPIINGT